MDFVEGLLFPGTHLLTIIGAPFIEEYLAMLQPNLLPVPNFVAIPDQAQDNLNHNFSMTDTLATIENS